MKQISTFLSHADKDKRIARKLADELNNFGFDVFVAHDDIVLGDEWEQTLKDEIKNRELFIALLSDNFRKAHFTDQEIGIASAYNKRIFPIRLDNTMPYGFMSRFQGSKKINPEIVYEEIEVLSHMLTSFTNESQKIIDVLIKNMKNATSYREANAIARELYDYRTFTNKQVNDIANAYYENSEVHGSWTAGPLTVDFLTTNWDRINKKNQKELESYFNRD